MKALLLATVFIITSVSNSFSQNTPTPPEPPTTTTSSSYSINISDDDNDCKNCKTSVSIKKNESVYKFRATFNSSKTEGIKTLLIKKLGQEYLELNNGRYTWNQKHNGEQLLECKLSKGLLKLLLNKHNASSSLIETISQLGMYLKDYISGSHSK